MIAHHGQGQHREKQGQQNVDRKDALQPDKPRILELRMSPEVIVPSYMAADGSATYTLHLAGTENHTQPTLALIIPTLREAENIGTVGQAIEYLEKTVSK